MKERYKWLIGIVVVSLIIAPLLSEPVSFYERLKAEAKESAGPRPYLNITYTEIEYNPSPTNWTEIKIVGELDMKENDKDDRNKYG